ncbi:MAG: nickel pincer cofactor biosynthesis protein LarC [Lawsonibacter sp.]|nr:nickel pincer cofactor biosynthesis protein LarC [Lawsonibacter sp.]
MKTLYFECNMGAAGDMLMAALYELLDEEQKKTFLSTMNALGLPGVEVAPVLAKTGGIAGTHMRVTVQGQEEHEHHHGQEHHHDHEHGHHHHHATPGHIGEVIDGLSLPDWVKTNAKAVYDAIAQAEAQAHGCGVGDVHYHEVGALDAVADITGVCLAIHMLDPDLIAASPVHVGSGTVHCAHGVMPVPAPATAALLKGVPAYGGEVKGELCTPTGAALLKTFVQDFGPMPVMETEKIGYGVGAKEFPQQANCLRAFWGESREGANGEIVELVCNLDDMTPEALAFACRRLLEAGALDVYTTPGTMKKGRPGWVLTALCPPEREGELARHILAQTTTNGLRSRRCGKYFLSPGAGTVQTQWGPVGVKLAQGFGVTHAKPEFEDAAALARAHGLAYQTVFEDAMRNLEAQK